MRLLPVLVSMVLFLASVAHSTGEGPGECAWGSACGASSGPLPTGQVAVSESCARAPVSPCYTTIQAAVDAAETLASDGARVVYVYPAEGDYDDIEGGATPLGAYEEDIDCTPADGHTTIKGVVGGFGLRGAPVLTGVAAATPTITLDHCSIENFLIVGRGGNSQEELRVAGVDVDHVGVRNVTVRPANNNVDNDSHVVEILHNDGSVFFENVKVTGDCSSPTADTSLVYFDMTGTAGTDPRFRWEGGRIAMGNPGGVTASKCVAGTAAIELVDTFPGAMFSNVSLACEGILSTCIEVNDDLVVDASFSNLSIEPPIADTTHGKLLAVVDMDTDGAGPEPDNDGVVTSKIYLDGINGLHMSWFGADVTEEEALIAGTSLFGALHWSGASTGVPAADSGIDECYPGWTFVDLQPGAAADSLYVCEGTTGGEGSWGGPKDP
jgi:hypothetical protein